MFILDSPLLLERDGRGLFCCIFQSQALRLKPFKRKTSVLCTENPIEKNQLHAYCISFFRFLLKHVTIACDSAEKTTRALKTCFHKHEGGFLHRCQRHHDALRCILGFLYPFKTKNLKLKKMGKMKKETWKMVIQLVISVLTAVAASLGVTSCM